MPRAVSPRIVAALALLALAQPACKKSTDRVSTDGAPADARADGAVDAGGGGGGGGLACTGVAGVSPGGNHTCARKTDGTLWCWGPNAQGQVGDGTNLDRISPVMVAALGSSVTAVTSGDGHACARKGDATLWCWGYNAFGQLGDGTKTDRSSPVAVMVLGSSVAQASAQGHHTCARKTDGTVWCWGWNMQGQLGDGSTTDSPTPVAVMSIATVVEVAAGANHSCARKGDGTLWCWGSNTQGQLGEGSTTDSPTPVQVTSLGTSVAAVAARGHHTCARKTDGTLWCWGQNHKGQVGDGTAMDRPMPVAITALGATVAEVAAGDSHTCARTTDGTLSCWGANNFGQLGDGTTDDRPTPAPVTALGTSVATVSAGGVHTCAVKTDGTLWCWGWNMTGALGDGTTTDRTTPTAVQGCP